MSFTEVWLIAWGTSLKILIFGLKYIRPSYGSMWKNSEFPNIVH